MVRNPTPLCAIKKITKEYPGIWDMLSYPLKDRFSEKGKDIPKEIFLPRQVYEKMVAKPDYYGWPNTPFKNIYSEEEQSCILAALCPWNYTQTIYEFDTDFFYQLANTINKDVIPFEALDRFPNYSIYLKHTGNWIQQYSETQEAKCIGMWIACAAGDESRRGFVFINHMVDRDSGNMMLQPFALPLSRGLTIQQAIEEAYESMGLKPEDTYEDEDDFMSHTEVVSRFVNVLLYLCANNADITDRTPKVKDRRFKLLSGITKSGKFQLFPCRQQKIFSVGQLMSRKMQEYGSAINCSNNPIRPHVRRAHWHGYWTGPLKSERVFILKWIAPTLVGTHNGYQELK